jgi:hypothetical protein
MYSLILTVSLIVNGVVSPDPVKVFEVKNGFSVEETCKGYLDTDEGTAFKKAVLPNIALRMQGSPYVIGFSCVSSESL